MIFKIENDNKRNFISLIVSKKEYNKIIEFTNNNRLNQRRESCKRNLLEIHHMSIDAIHKFTEKIANDDKLRTQILDSTKDKFKFKILFYDLKDTSITNLKIAIMYYNLNLNEIFVDSNNNNMIEF